MNRRKGWSSLSAGYRQRLIRQGITKHDYDTGQSLRSARGHGSHTPSETRKREERYERFIRSGQYQRLIDQGAKLGYVPRVGIEQAFNELGPARLKDILEWQEQRHESYKDLNDKGTDVPNFKQWLIERQGEAVWDEYWGEWWDDNGDLETGWTKYH